MFRGRKTERWWEKKKEGDRTRARRPHHTRSHIKDAYLRTSAEEAPTHAHTNTDKPLDRYIQPRCSPRSFATAVHTTPRSIRSPFTRFLVNAISRFREKKRKAFSRTYCFSSQVLPREEIIARSTGQDKEGTSWTRRIPLRCRSRRWHRYSVLEEIPAAWGTLRVAPRSRSTFTFVGLLPVRAYRLGRFQTVCKKFRSMVVWLTYWLTEEH